MSRNSNRLAPRRTDHPQSLLTDTGQRKYLSEAERRQFYKALDSVDEVSRTFCEMIYWTGCRPSEALALSRSSINVSAAHVVIRSLKKRHTQKGKHYRIVPLPLDFVKRLARVHGLSAQDRSTEHSDHKPLFAFGRTTGWARMAAVMKAAGISGPQACARGLRHSFGVNAALNHVPETRIQKWLGHAHLGTTAIYLDLAALEDREMAGRMWGHSLPNDHGSVFGETLQPVTGPELARLVTAYAAIPEAAPRLSLLDRIEDRAAGPLPQPLTTMAG